MKSNEKRRRPYAKRACKPCRASKVACDNSRPCDRCVKRGIEKQCIDAARKRRSRACTEPPLESLSKVVKEKDSVGNSTSGSSSSADVNFDFDEIPSDIGMELFDPMKPPPVDMVDYMFENRLESPPCENIPLDQDEMWSMSIRRPVVNSSVPAQFVSRLNLPDAEYVKSLRILAMNFVADCATVNPFPLSETDLQRFTVLLDRFCGFYVGFLRNKGPNERLDTYPSRWLRVLLEEIQTWVGEDSYSVHCVRQYLVTNTEEESKPHTLESVLGEPGMCAFAAAKTYSEALPFPALQYVLQPNPYMFPSWPNVHLLRHSGKTFDEWMTMAQSPATSMSYMSPASREKMYLMYPEHVREGKPVFESMMEVYSASTPPHPTLFNSIAFISYAPGTRSPLWILLVLIPSALDEEVCRSTKRGMSVVVVCCSLCDDSGATYVAALWADVSKLITWDRRVSVELDDNHTMFTKVLRDTR